MTAEPPNDAVASMRVVLYMKDGMSSGASYYRLLQYRPVLDGIPGVHTRVRTLAPAVLSRARSDISGVRTSAVRRMIVRIGYTVITMIRGVCYLCWDIVRGTDTVVVGRSLFPRTLAPPISWLYRRLLENARTVLWDFDDDIMSSKEISAGEATLLADSATTIVVTHGGLRDLLPAAARRKTVLLATTDGDFGGGENRSDDQRLESFAHELRLVWVASSSGLADLRSVASALDRGAAQVQRRYGKRVRLEVVCNLPLDSEFQHLQIINTRWTRALARKAIESAHVGIMPLLESDFARGKGGFKIVQYMASGLPAIASSVGFNKEVVLPGVTGYLVNERNEDEWSQALIDLAGDEEQWRQMCAASRARWTTLFPFDRNATFWAAAVVGSAQTGLNAWQS